MTLSPYSRYHETPISNYNGVETFIEWRPPFFGNVNEYIYTVNATEVNNIDAIAYKVWGMSELWWVILYHNKVNDPFTLEVGQRLKIPDYNRVIEVLEGKRRAPLQKIIPPNPLNFKVKLIRPVVIPRWQPPEASATDVTPTEVYLFNFGFPVPEGLVGNVHFQLQASQDSSFSAITFSKMTSTSISRWFYYSSVYSAFKPFPTNGIDGQTTESQTVYFKVLESDGFAKDTEYYFRYRAWVNDLEGPWFAAPPVVIV